MFDLLFLAIQSDSSRVFTAGFGMHNHVIEIDGITDWLPWDYTPR